MFTEIRKFYSDLKEFFLFFYSILFKAHLCEIVYCIFVIIYYYRKLSINELYELVYISLKCVFVSFSFSLLFSILASIFIVLTSGESNNIEKKFINEKNNTNV